jgi:hypothetical protein
MKPLAIVLIVLGIVMALSTGIQVVTHKKVVDVGPIEVTKEEKTPIYWSPWTGIFLVAAGTVILVSSRKKIA